MQTLCKVDDEAVDLLVRQVDLGMKLCCRYSLDFIDYVNTNENSLGITSCIIQ
jgi:hypothetical protein